MPSLAYSALVQSLERAVTLSGYAVAIVSEPADVPARLLINGPNLAALPVWAYIKNLTPADRADPDEYRIQLHSKILPLAQNPSGPTVLLGYHAGTKLFVGFDPTEVSTGARTQLSGGYVSLNSVKRAKRRGMSFDRDRRNRIAVGMRPDLLVSYFLNSTEIHAAVDESDITQILDRAAAAYTTAVDTEFEEQIPSQPYARQRLLRSVYQLARDAGFRKRVLGVYEHRCAISGAQLGLVEAAHILPVRVEGSTDEVQNGLSLLPHFHRAFDSGLIYLTPDYIMRVNLVRVRQLEGQKLDGGLDDLRGSLGRIRLPNSSRFWPKEEFIIKGNSARGVDVG